MTEPKRIIVVKPDPYQHQRALRYGLGSAPAPTQPPPAITDEEVAEILAAGFVPEDDDWEQDPSYVEAMAAYTKAKRISAHLGAQSTGLWKDPSTTPIEKEAMQAALTAAHDAQSNANRAVMQMAGRAKERNAALVAAYRKPFIASRMQELLAEAEEQTD